MLVSLFTDASQCPDTAAGGWGAWARSERGTVERGGELRELMGSSNDAELCAIANGLDMVVRSGVFEAGDAVLVQSDCLHALGCLKGTIRIMTLTQKMVMNFIEALVAEHGVRVRCRHIKGHQEGGGRNWVNRRCDDLARAGMRRARKRYYGKHGGTEA